MVRELSEPVPSRFQHEMLTICTNYIDNAFASISSHYGKWDDSRNAYNAVIKPRTKDEYANEDERPMAQSVPMTYSQIKTFQAFCTSVLSQRPRQFEHKPGGKEDAAMVDLSETLLEQDLCENRWKTKRGQLLQCLGLYGLAVTHTGFKQDHVGLVFEQEEAGTTAFGQAMTAKKIVAQDIIRYNGNEITVVSPYKYLPDPAFDMCDQHKARFQGHEFEISIQDLRMMQQNGEVAGVEHVRTSFATERWDKRNKSYGVRYDYYKQDNKQTEIIVITALQLRIIPAHFKLIDDTPLGNLNAPTIVNVWIANDSRIIKCEISGHLHGQFCYDVAAFDNEKHELLGKSVAEVMSELQKTTDWFLNSKIETVTRNVEPQLVYDPYTVETSDLVNNERLIRLKKGAGRFGMDALIKQLDIRDTTSRHMDDIAQINRIMYEVTGINANMAGQFHTGRRSATEAKVVSGGAASRMMTMLAEVWESLFTPLGTKANCNLRQGLTAEDILDRCGDHPPEVLTAYKSTPIKLARARDLWILDSTTPSEKGFQAQWLTEVFGMVMANPMAAIQLDLSPRLILEKGMELQGITFRENIRLSNDPQTLQQVVMQMAQQLAQQMLMQQQQQQQEPPANPQ